MLSHIMLSGPTTSRRRMPIVSSWKLKTTLRRKKSLGNMPSPAFARAGPPPSRGQALEPVDRLAVALAVGVAHRGEQMGRPCQPRTPRWPVSGGDDARRRRRRSDRTATAPDRTPWSRGCWRRAMSCRRPRGSCPAAASPCVGSAAGRAPRRRPRTARTRTRRSAGARVDIR
jgi:hypothetical protein